MSHREKPSLVIEGFLLVLEREEDSSWRYDLDEPGWRKQGWCYADFVKGKIFVYSSSSSTGIYSMPTIGGYVFPMGMVTVVGYNDGGLVRKKDPVMAILFFW